MSLNLFLNKDTFLNHFKVNDTINKHLTIEQFENELMIMYNEPMTLHEINNFKLKTKTKMKKNQPVFENREFDPRYIKRKEIVIALYDILITNKELYLERFYNSYFPIINPLKLDWNNVELDISAKFNDVLSNDIYISVQLNDNSRKLIRNMFYLELLDKTKIINTVKSHESFWYSLTTSFNELKLQDRFFAKSSLDLIMRKCPSGEYTQTFFYLFQSYLPKASILNPYSIKWIIENKLEPLLPKSILAKKSKTIVSPVLSWCSYLISFMHLNDTWKNYIGIDVMSVVCEKAKMLREHYFNLDNVKYSKDKKKVKIICKPSEILHKEGKFENVFHGKTDLVISCFPYFNMEEYSDGEQSTKNYPNYEDWLNEYIRPTIKMCSNLLCNGGLFVYITNNFSTLDKKYYDLKSDFKNICNSEKTLEYIEEYMLVNRTSPLRNVKKDRIETMYVFQKIK